jgi:hypothetical protein
MADTLLLDTSTWDLVLDANGNMAAAHAPYALAQDAASAIRTFLGEVYYDTTVGVPYSLILGVLPPVEFVRQQFIAAAETVPGVASAKVFFSSFTARELSGQVQVTDAAGVVTTANF